MPYRLIFAGSVRSQLSSFKDKAKAVGLGKDLAAVLSGIVNDLAHRPTEVGEIMYHLPYSRMPVKTMARAYIGVTFAVHEPEGVVFVMKMRMLFDNPFPKGYDRLFNG